MSSLRVSVEISGISNGCINHVARIHVHEVQKVQTFKKVWVVTKIQFHPIFTIYYLSERNVGKKTYIAKYDLHAADWKRFIF